MSKLARHYHRLAYFCRDAWDEWRHSFAVNLTALVTLAASLFVAALVILIVSNVAREVGRLREEVRVDIYLQEVHDEQDRQALVAELQAMEGVVRVDYVGKDEALRRYQGHADGAWPAVHKGQRQSHGPHPLRAHHHRRRRRNRRPRGDRCGGGGRGRGQAQEGPRGLTRFISQIQ